MSSAVESAALLVVDEDDYALAMLLDGLRTAGFTQVAGCNALARVADHEPALIIFNLHAPIADAHAHFQFIKRAHPKVSILLLVAPGEIQRQVDAWADEPALVDVTLAKPLREGLLSATIRQLLAVRAPDLLSEQRNRNLASILPQAAVDTAQALDHAVQLDERSILFTDVRGSSTLIERLEVKEFFDGLNDSLTAQAASVRRNQGEVIKFTGDGMMAVFRGMARVHLALRCALELQRLDATQAHDSTRRRFGVGIGLADGLVLSGFVGDSTRRQYDVIGANVHLAARLCALAPAGHIVLPQDTLARAYLPVANVTALGALAIKGFSLAVRCCAIGVADSETSER